MTLQMDEVGFVHLELLSQVHPASVAMEMGRHHPLLTDCAASGKKLDFRELHVTD